MTLHPLLQGSKTKARERRMKRPAQWRKWRALARANQKRSRRATNQFWQALRAAARALYEAHP